MERDADSKKELIEGLKKAAQGNSRTKTARLREIFDEVEAAKDSGLSLKTIVAVLADRGLVFDLATFVNVRQRIKKERAASKGHVEVKTTTDIKISTANLSDPAMNIKTNKPIQEKSTNQNPFHKLTGEQKEGKFNPVPLSKPEIDN